MDTQDPVLEMAGVSILTGDMTTSVLPLGRDLVIRRGEAIALCAASGSERDTWFECAALLLPVVSGNYKIDGESTADLSDRRRSMLRSRIGLVSHRIPLISDLSAEDNVAVPLIYSGRGIASAMCTASKALSYVGLGDRGKSLPDSLNLEESQLAEIARALASEPSFILMHDPLGEVGAALTGNALSFIMKARDERGIATVFVCSRESEALMKHCDRVIYSGGDDQWDLTQSSGIPRQEFTNDKAPQRNA